MQHNEQFKIYFTPIAYLYTRFSNKNNSCYCSYRENIKTGKILRNEFTKTATKKVTLDEFRLAELRLLPTATGELSNLLREIALAAKRIHAEVRHGGLRNISGYTELTNSSGEPVKKIDRFANDELINVLRNSISCAGAASEE